MAVATTAAVDSRKSVFRRALTALRYAVAAAVTVVVVMTAVYAFHVAARTDDLFISVGPISVYPLLLLPPPPNQQRPPYPKLSFTLSAHNPSGRVRFYYTGIQCVLSVNDSSIQNSTFGFPDIVVAPDAVMELDTDEADFNSTSMLGAKETLTWNLTLTGNLTVGVYSVYNKTSVPTTYYCRNVTVGSVNGTSPWSTTSCYTRGYIEKYNPIE